MESNQIQEDMHFIKKMLENNQRTLVDNGLSYIINGLGIAVGLPITITMGFIGMEIYIPYIWLLLIAIMVILNLIASKRIEKKQKVKTFGSEVFQAVWGACGLSVMLIFVFSFTTAGMTHPAFFTSVASILAIGYLLTGVINNLKFMKVLAIFWWLTAFVSGIWEIFFALEYLPFFFSFMVLVLQLVPATIIYKKWKRAYHE